MSSTPGISPVNGREEVKRLVPLLSRGRYFTVCGRVFRTPREHRRMYRQLYRQPAGPLRALRGVVTLPC